MEVSHTVNAGREVLVTLIIIHVRKKKGLYDGAFEPTLFYGQRRLVQK